MIDAAFSANVALERGLEDVEGPAFIRFTNEASAVGNERIRRIPWAKARPVPRDEAENRIKRVAFFLLPGPAT